MIIDFHTHVFPDRLAASTLEFLSAQGHILPHTNGTAEGLLASMKRAGVDCSVILPVATNPKQVNNINHSAAVINETFGARGLISFGCIHPECEQPEEELRRAAELGLKGIKIHPVYQGTDLDHPKYLRILEQAGKLGMIVVTHGGIDIGYPNARQSAPEKILRAVQQVGPVKLVAAHMGGWKQWEEAEALLAETSVYLDTSFSTGVITPSEKEYFPPEELAMMSRERFLHMVRTFGEHRILFGTDSPWTDQQESIRRITAMPLTTEGKTAILGKNAELLLTSVPTEK